MILHVKIKVAKINRIRLIQITIHDPQNVLLQVSLIHTAKSDS